MAGESPFRKKPRFPGKPEASEGGPEQADDARRLPADPSAHLPSPDAHDDGRGPSASLEPADDGAGPRRSLVAAGSRGVDLVRRGVRKGGTGARAGLAYLADRIIEGAPRVPVRDLATLRRQFPGLGPEQLADRLVAGAAKASATVGAGVGAAAMLPVPPAMPAELAAEITGVAAIELKLIAELHEVYGQRPPGTLKERSMAYLTAWTEERGVDITKPTTLNAALGGRMRRELRQRIMKRTVRNLPNLLPFMVGATVGAVMNRRDTKKLAEQVRGDLRARQVPWDALPDLPPLEQPESPDELGR
ncbi:MULTISPECIES: hypothetical protein [Streptomyces]|uniref:EcsC protein family protein n=1 Tax=Streptomyces sudanensis TaxID=436397 RepID=A0ABY4THI1_9ACTN|nr:MULTISPECIES: hypothetical protein [Streptomyces]MCP9956942.1 hypothetical protein [Streptomyces sudanensis]MCP9986145.1 hypothetical protein [Streptomyces sudanensis]MCQ0002474.1 hypothetical protein [Streptomyces sudanensis]URN17243.1 hypothetical protein MW084_16430 [Streptomyces sudanensis]